MKNLSDKSKVETINGHQVVVTDLPRTTFSQILCTAHADGLSFYIDQDGKHPPMDLVTLFRDHLRLLGPTRRNGPPSPSGNRPQHSPGAVTRCWRPGSLPA